jgi:HrpA-like RNA helicase
MTSDMDAEASNLEMELSRLEKVYEDNQNYPVWPFNYNLLKAFAASQAVPLLGLTGLGAPILNVIRSMLDFLYQIGGP